ncbi:MAG: hypothetical protein U9Q88_05655 [Bacillota bacterium]|nr:hypothetical protein [Bacillota bacterium]
MKIQKLVDSIHYWESKVLAFDIKYFADEIILKCEAGTYIFKGCYHLEIKHTPKFEKGIPPEKWTFAQLPYTIHDISVNENNLDSTSRYKVNITTPPMFVELCCNEVTVNPTSD